MSRYVIIEQVNGNAKPKVLTADSFVEARHIQTREIWQPEAKNDFVIYQLIEQPVSWLEAKLLAVMDWISYKDSDK